MDKKVSLVSFFEEIFQLSDFRGEVVTCLGKEQAEIFFKGFLNGEVNQEVIDSVHDIMYDFIQDNSMIEEEYTAWSSGDCFPISILSLGPVFWVSAQEFGSTRYFRSLSDAREFVEEEYGEYLSEEEDDWDD